MSGRIAVATFARCFSLKCSFLVVKLTAVTALVAIKVVPVTGGEPTTLVSVSPPESLAGVSWTPDGRFLVFARNDTAMGKPEIWRVEVDSGELRPCGLQMDDTTVFELSVHPRGDRLAFSAGDAARGEVRVLKGVL